MTDTIEEIRARHEADKKTIVWESDYGPTLIAARIDRATLLRALDAATEENAMLNRAVSEISLGVQSGVDLQTSIDRLVKIARDASKPVVDNEAPSTERAALKEPGQ